MVLWLKSFHIIFMVCWFAGIFYLPRIFVYYANSTDKSTKETLSVMARKLFFFVTPFAILTIFLGAALFSINPQMYLHSSWFLIKIGLVFLLILYHLSCYYYLKKILDHSNTKSHVFFRFYNELPVLLLFAIVLLVVLKPSL